MSRLARKPVIVPSGVKVSLNAGLLSIEGPKGKLQNKIGSGVDVKVEGSQISFTKGGDDKVSRANLGTAKALVNNMVLGVTQGWKRSLELVGVGYKADVQGGKFLNLVLGFSHPVKFEIPKEIKLVVDKATIINMESCDRQLLGNFAAKVRKVKPPEPYLGKGIKYSDEAVRRKAGKTGKK